MIAGLNLKIHLPTNISVLVSFHHGNTKGIYMRRLRSRILSILDLFWLLPSRRRNRSLKFSHRNSYFPTTIKFVKRTARPNPRSATEYYTPLALSQTCFITVFHTEVLFMCSLFPFNCIGPVFCVPIFHESMCLWRCSTQDFHCICI